MTRQMAMVRTLIVTAGLMLGTLAGASAASAQEHSATEVGRQAVDPHKTAAEATQNKVDITHHIGNAHEIERPFGAVVHLPRFAPIHLGSLTLDLSPTRHFVFMLLSAILVAVVFITSARRIARAQAQGKPAKGFAGAMEATCAFHFTPG
jgi:F-type H+-transporting ATPase subunit a